MNDASFKPSLGLESILGPDIATDSEGFLLFLKAYYEWLQSTRLTLTNISGTFVRGEEIVGQTSGGKAKVEEVGDGYIVVRITTRIVFNNHEEIVGQTSAASATIVTIKDNVVRESGNLINYRNLETSIDQYVDYLRDELYHNIPTRYFGDKRLIATKFRSFFESRSNEDSFRFLFKLLYNENIDFYYPGEDVLRVSDGNFEKTQVIRVAVTADIFEFLNKNIRGTTTNYFANVVDIKTFFINSIEVAELTLKLVSGTFQAGETIVVVDDATLTTTIYGIVSGFQIVDAGSGYEVGDEVIISGDGGEAQAVVASIKESPISALSINNIGYGYQLNTEATINNAGTGGSDLVVRVTGITDTYTVTSGANTYTVGEVSRVQILNRGSGYYKTPTITLIDSEIEALGLLSPKLITINNAGSNYGVGNTLTITGGSGANATGVVASVVEATSYDFLFEDGQGMVLDGSYEDVLKNEDWSPIGPIARIELTNYGDGYTNASLPSITVNSTTGSSANIVFTGIQGTSANVSVDVANNIAGIGSIRSINVTNFGINYTTATANTTASGDGNANVIPIIAGLGTKEGIWVDDDGKIDYKFIQDSYFYQDFSYVIKSGLSFNYYKDVIKKIIHPVGLQMFGEILIQDFIDITPRMSTEIEALRSIERYLVYILSEFSVDVSISPSSTTSLILEPPAISLVSDLLDEQEYRIEIVCGGNETRQNLNAGISTGANPVLYLASPILDAALAAELRIELGEKVFSKILQILVDLDMQMFVSGKTNLFVSNAKANTTVQASYAAKEWQIAIEPQAISLSTGYDIAPTTKLVVEYVQVVPGYGYLTYGDLPLYSGGGVFGDDFANTPIATLASVTFDTPYYENPAFQALYTQYVKNVSIQSHIVDTSSNVKFTLENAFNVESTTFELPQEIFSESSTELAISSESDYTKYQKIQGTVSYVEGSTYGNLTISDLAAATIGSVASASFDETISLTVGNGTFFTTDFAIDDIFVANNEYFTVRVIFSDTNLAADRPPSSPYTNVPAYKVVA